LLGANDPEATGGKKMAIAYENKIDGGIFCNDCACGDPTQAKAIEVQSGINCDDCSEVIA